MGEGVILTEEILPQVAVGVSPNLGGEHASVRVEVEGEGVPSCFGEILIANVAYECGRGDIDEEEVEEEVLADDHVGEAIAVDLEFSLSSALAVLKINQEVTWDFITFESRKVIEKRKDTYDVKVRACGWRKAPKISV